MSTPILIETSNPEVFPRYWTVRADADLPDYQVAMHIDQGLRAAIIQCSCGSRYSWSIGVDFDLQPCAHIVPVCLAVLEERKGGLGNE